VGGRFRVRFRLISGEEHESFGVFLEFAPDERFAMSWRWAGGVADPGESRIDVTIRPVPDGAEVTFTHSRLDSEETRHTHEDGWTGAIAKLERYCAARPGR
jgi:uncharacterized protein YndB with AHSA1/START domain